MEIGPPPPASPHLSPPPPASPRLPPPVTANLDMQNSSTWLDLITASVLPRPWSGWNVCGTLWARWNGCRVCSGGWRRGAVVVGGGGWWGHRRLLVSVAGSLATAGATSAASPLNIRTLLVSSLCVEWSGDGELWVLQWYHKKHYCGSESLWGKA